jgi:hypothetical protein
VLNIYSLCNIHCDDTMKFVYLCVRPFPEAHMSLLYILFLFLKMGVRDMHAAYVHGGYSAPRLPRLPGQVVESTQSSVKSWETQNIISTPR